jgi:hypothetical protein
MTDHPNPPGNQTFFGTAEDDDIYHVGPGTGQDVVIEPSAPPGIVDVLEVDGGLTASGIAVIGTNESDFFTQHYGLRVVDLATGDSIELQDQITDTTTAKVETLRFGPAGSTIDLTVGIDMHGTSPSPLTPGYSGDDTFFGSLLGDTYHIGPGIGHDVVVERGTTGGVSDVLQVDGGLTASGIAVIGTNESDFFTQH